MSLWKSRDNANGAPLYAPAQKNQAPTLANANNMFEANSAAGNTSIVGIRASEVAANRAIPHTGWVLKTEGSGGRAGRTFHEVLVAGGMKLGINTAVITIDTQPSSQTAPTNSNASFSVAASVVPTTELDYRWQFSINSTAAFTTITSNSLFVNAASTTLTISNTAGLDGFRFRAVVFTVDADVAPNVTSSNATLTVNP